MPPNVKLYFKMITAGLVTCIGGPALVFYVSPSEEEIFKRYSPELQKRSLETRQQRLEEFDHFVTKLKEYSKSDKPIWVVAAEADKQEKAQRIAEQKRIAEEQRRQREELKKEQGLLPK